jgi:membrane dipeptidase
MQGWMNDGDMPEQFLIVDAHEDLAYNMLTFGRDYTLPAHETRRREAGTQIPTWNNGDCLIGWPDYQRGRVAVVFSTLFAAPLRRKGGDWDVLCYSDTAQARRLYRRQMDAYLRLADDHPEKFRLVGDLKTLDAVLAHWKNDPSEQHPVGLVPLMEGAEAIGEPAEVEDWWAAGLRIIGPAWVGTRFCGGTGEPGPLTPEGYALLGRMAEFGFILDISHMDELAALQALEHYPGRAIASHSNALALLKGSESNRHLSDRVIRALLERSGVIGVLPLGGFIKAGWKRGDDRAEIALAKVANQIDYLCQMAGSAHQVGIGSDFDGGYGVQSSPLEVDTIADLQKLAPLLAEKGYTPADIAAVMGENWLAALRAALPESA